MITENLSTLKIHKLTQSQYDRELEAGNIDENALYLTPDDGVNIKIDATLTQEGTAADAKAVGDALDLKADQELVDDIVGTLAEHEDIHNILQSQINTKAAKTDIPTIPTALPNPNALTINGQVYDGSAEVNVDIQEQISADWNQNDSTKHDYIKNRTHYTEINSGELLPETSITTSRNQYGMDGQIGFVAGKTYTIVWDGVEYRCVAGNVKYNGLPVVAVGNTIFIAGADTGEPFAICDIPINNYIGFAVLTDGTYTVSIFGEQEVVHTLDKKYLPNQKLSDFENDLYHPAKREAFITLTPADFILNEEIGYYVYTTSPKLDWLTSADVIGFELISTRSETPLTEDTLKPTYEVEDGACFVNFIPNALMLVNGANILTGEIANIYSIFILADAINEIKSFTFYKKTPAKKIPEEYIEIPEKLPNPNALTINGQVYDGSTVVNMEINADIPEKLPNPNALTINGQSYDGSSAKTIEILEAPDMTMLVSLLNDMALGINIENMYDKVNAVRKVVNAKKHGVVKEDDGYPYCYVNDVIQTVSGLTWYGKSHLIFIGASENGALATGKYTLSNSQNKPYGFADYDYDWGNDGKYYPAGQRLYPCVDFAPESTCEIVEIDGIQYYYENGICKPNAGVVMMTDESNRTYFILVKPDGTIQTGVNRAESVGFLPAGDYDFGSNGILPICNVSYNFANVTSDYNYLAVAKNNSVIITLTATSGYTISNVVVTMDGYDVTSTVYNEGVISIAEVTGDIVVIATAETTT